MLPTIPVKDVIVTSDYRNSCRPGHKGTDIQARPGWKGGTKGRGEPVCSPVDGWILQIHWLKEWVKGSDGIDRRRLVDTQGRCINSRGQVIDKTTGKLILKNGKPIQSAKVILDS